MSGADPARSSARRHILTDFGSATRAFPTFNPNIYAPTVAPFPNFTNVVMQPSTTSESLLTSFGIIDNVYAFEDNLQLILGRRQQCIQVSNYN